MRWAFRGIFGITGLYLIANYFSASLPGWWNTLLHILFGVSLVVFVFSLDTGKFRACWDFVAQRTKARGESIRTIVESGFWKIEEGKNITAEVVVFGHTHRADDSRHIFCPQHKKRFINSGSWGFDKIKKSRIRTPSFISTRTARCCAGGYGKTTLPGTLNTSEKHQRKNRQLWRRRISALRLWFRKNFSHGG